jgi:NUMOD3 motif
MNEYYTYAYLREDKTPYYIGKGKGNRLYKKGSRVFAPPKDKSRIIYLKQNLTEEEAFKHEIYMIDVFGRKDLGTGILYNRTGGGDGVSGVIRSEETRRKISVANKGENHPMYNKTHSEESKRKISVAKKGENNHNYGKIFSEETRRKMSESSKNPSEETRKKLSDTNRGENNPNYGKTASEETKKRMSDAHKNPPEEIRIKMSEASKGTKWWNDGCGNRKRMIECPGNGWRLGRK